MTPFEFGQFIKRAVETGGFGEYLGQGFDRGVQSLTNAVGLGNGIAPSAFTGKPAPAAPAAAPRPQRVMPGPGPTAPPAAPPAAPPQQRTMPGPGPSATPARPAPAAPRPAAPARPPRAMPGPGAAPAAPAPANDPGYTSTAELMRRKRQGELERMAAGARMAAPQYRAPTPPAPAPAQTQKPLPRNVPKAAPAQTAGPQSLNTENVQAAPGTAPLGHVSESEDDNAYLNNPDLYDSDPAAAVREYRASKQQPTRSQSGSSRSTETREGGITTSRNGQPVALTPEQQRTVDGVRRIRKQQEDAVNGAGGVQP